MSLTSLLVDSEKLIPFEVFWRGVSVERRRRVFTLLEQGELAAQGRPLLVVPGASSKVCLKKTPFETELGEVFDIPMGRWRDSDNDFRHASASGDKAFKLLGPAPEETIVDIRLYNTETLREFVGYEEPSIPVTKYDDLFFLSTGRKIGLEVFANASAALGSEKVEPKKKKLASYLLDNDNIWPRGQKPHERTLQQHIAPLVDEYIRLKGR